MKNLDKNVIRSLIQSMSLSEKIEQMNHLAPSIPHLNIPAYSYWNEGLHGLARAGVATVFPQAIGLAATFHMALIKKMARVIGLEARAKYNSASAQQNPVIYQGLHLWSPNINIFRDPRWGRGQETFGEDPYLTTQMAKAYLQGLKGTSQDEYPLALGTLKHYYAHSGPENIRHQMNSTVSLKDTEETYLYAFKKVIKESPPAMVMTAYNRINDKLASGNYDLIQEQLVKNLGFKGLIVADCWAIQDFHQGHQITRTPKESALLALRSGIHLACGESFAPLLEETLAEEDIQKINQSLEKILLSRFQLGLFDPQSKHHQITFETLYEPTHHRLNQRIADESIVLLKNQSLLPLKKGQKIAVLGPNAQNIYALYGNYHGTPHLIETLFEGMKKVMLGFDLRVGLGFSYEKRQAWEEDPTNEAMDLAHWADIVVVITGLDNRREGEENDAPLSQEHGDKPSLEYPSHHWQMIEKIRQVNDQMVLVHVSGSAMILHDEKIPTVVQQFYGGTFAGRALGRMLAGYSNPSGRLPVSFYKDEKGLPEFKNYSMQGRTYKYGHHLIKYPFGHGLSYTQFKLVIKNHDYRFIHVWIENIGTRSGLTPVLVYAQFPGQPEAPHFQLISGTKLQINPQKRRLVKLNFDPVGVYNQAGQLIETEYTLWISTSHPDYDKEAIKVIPKKGNKAYA